MVLEVFAFRYIVLATQLCCFDIHGQQRSISSELLVHDNFIRSSSPSLQLSLLAGPLEPFGLPSWNPFFALRETDESDRMRPVPVVFLRFAFSPQLSILFVSIFLLDSLALESHLPYVTSEVGNGRTYIF